MPKSGSDSLNVKLTRRQAVTYSGKNLTSVTLVGNYLEVVKKRPRSGQFDKHHFPLNKVLAYSPGNGGIEGTAYATVINEVVIKDVTGVAVFDANWIRVIDQHNVAHEINVASDAECSLTEPIETNEDGFEDAPTAKKRVVKKFKPEPKTKTRGKKLDTSVLDF